MKKIFILNLIFLSLYSSSLLKKIHKKTEPEEIELKNMADPNTPRTIINGLVENIQEIDVDQDFFNSIVEQVPPIKNCLHLLQQDQSSIENIELYNSGYFDIASPIAKYYLKIHGHNSRTKQKFLNISLIERVIATTSILDKFHERETIKRRIKHQVQARLESNDKLYWRKIITERPFNIDHTKKSKVKFLEDYYTKKINSTKFKYKNTPVI